MWLSYLIPEENSLPSQSHADALHGASSPKHVLFHQVQIQDATLAGLAVMGMAGEMLVTPFGALIAGFLVGLISPLGFRFFTVSHLGTAKDTDPGQGTICSQTCKHSAAAQPPGQPTPSPVPALPSALPSPFYTPG